MASYRVLIKPSAVKELEAIPLKDRKRLARRIERLAKDPRPPGCEKLSGLERYRIRQGNYRVIYGIEDENLIVLVVRVAHRRDVYHSARNIVNMGAGKPLTETPISRTSG